MVSRGFQMPRRLSSQAIFLAALIWFLGLGAQATPRPLEPIVYTIRFTALETHYADIEVRVPTERRATVEMMMAVWSPGFYRVEDYASRVESLSVQTPDGVALKVQQPRKNRWQIETNGAPAVILSYRLLCNQRSVTTNWIGDDYAVLNGAAAFITLVEQAHRPHEVRLELPAKWKRSMTALDPAPDSLPNHYRAVDYDTLVDSPIVAGNPVVNVFEVDGSKHFVVDIGAVGQWDSQRAAQDLEKIVAETRRFW